VGTPRLFAVDRLRRFAMSPDAPPLQEASVAGCETATRLVTAPCPHAVEIRRPLASEIDRLLLLPEVRDRLTAWCAEPVGGTPSG
jgi:tripartite-type tricarboxylate transporter receptor subunit TctC